MNKFKKYIPYLAAVVLFVALAYAYAPDVLSGKVVNQSDITGWRGMAKQTLDYNKANPSDPTLWSDSMFGGMPTYSFAADWKGDWTEPVYKALFWGKRPPSYLIIALLGAFLMFLAFGVDVWLAIIGALALAFCSYNMQIIQVGHNTKMIAIAFMPWVVAALMYGYRKNAFLGAVFFAFAMSFEIKANHPQISYYLAFIVLALIIAELVQAVKEKAFMPFFKRSCILLVGGLLGIAVNANNLVTLTDYSKYTMRGGSELAQAKSGSEAGKGGLDLEYATAWSYGIEETPNLMIPNFNGGASAAPLSKSSATYKTLKGRYQGADQLIEQMPVYWGPQPFTAGPMYMGAIMIFLAVLGLVVVKGRYKWALAVVGALSVFLGWGSHMMWFSEIFFKYVPLYNKFRTVSMSLTILQVVIPLLGVLALNEILKGNVDSKTFKKGLIVSGALTAGFCLLAAAVPSIAGDFSGAADASYPKDIVKALMVDRAAVLRSDALRSLVFILAAGAVVFLLQTKKLKPAYATAVLAVLVLADFWGVDKRYLNSTHFMVEKQFKNPYPLRAADRFILQDKEPGFRVLDISQNTFNSSYTSYYHNSIGGYSPAKLSRYQDVIDTYLMNEIRSLASGEFEKEFPVLSMLNTKYVIYDNKSMPLPYEHGYGAAWTVDSIVEAGNPVDEIAYLSHLDLRHNAVIGGVAPDYRSEGLKGSVEMTSYSPKDKKYLFESDEAKVVVMSDIWYPSGWKAYIDGAETQIFRADYILKAVKVPAGKHEIELVFEPETVAKGKSISLACSAGILILTILAALGICCEKKKRKQE